MTFAEIRDTIKTETRELSQDYLDASIDTWINQSYQSYTRRYTFYELREPETEVTLESTGICSLPSDFQHLANAYYCLDSLGGSPNQLKPYGENTLPIVNGVPNWYLVSGSNIRLFPSSGIDTTNHLLKIDYYKKPEQLVADEDEPVVAGIDEVLVPAVCARVARFSNSQAEQSFKSDAEVAFRNLLATRT